MPSGDVIKWEHTDATLARHLERAEDIASEAAAAQAIATQDGARRLLRFRLALALCAAGATSRPTAPKAGPLPNREPPGPAWPKSVEPLSERRLSAQKEGSTSTNASGASQAGECPAPGISTNRAPRRVAISCWTSGGQASSVLAERRRAVGTPVAASTDTSSGAASSSSPMTRNATGLSRAVAARAGTPARRRRRRRCAGRFFSSSATTSASALVPLSSTSLSIPGIVVARRPGSAAGPEPTSR